MARHEVELSVVSHICLPPHAPVFFQVPERAPIHASATARCREYRQIPWGALSLCRIPPITTPSDRRGEFVRRYAAISRGISRLWDAGALRTLLLETPQSDVVESAGVFGLLLRCATHNMHSRGLRCPQMHGGLGLPNKAKPWKSSGAVRHSPSPARRNRNSWYAPDHRVHGVVRSPPSAWISRFDEVSRIGALIQAPTVAKCLSWALQLSVLRVDVAERRPWMVLKDAGAPAALSAKSTAALRPLWMGGGRGPPEYIHLILEKPISTNLK